MDPKECNTHDLFHRPHRLSVSTAFPIKFAEIPDFPDLYTRPTDPIVSGTVDHPPTQEGDGFDGPPGSPGGQNPSSHHPIRYGNHIYHTDCDKEVPKDYDDN